MTNIQRGSVVYADCSQHVMSRNVPHRMVSTKIRPCLVLSAVGKTIELLPLTSSPSRQREIKRHEKIGGIRWRDALTYVADPIQRLQVPTRAVISSGDMVVLHVLESLDNLTGGTESR